MGTSEHLHIHDHNIISNLDFHHLLIPGLANKQCLFTNDSQISMIRLYTKRSSVRQDQYIDRQREPALTR